jgi:hypothetical protein
MNAAPSHTGHFGKWHMGGQRDVDDAPPITAYGPEVGAGSAGPFRGSKGMLYEGGIPWFLPKPGQVARRDAI